MEHSIEDILKEGKDLMERFLSKDSSLEETALGMWLSTTDFLEEQLEKKFPNARPNSITVALLQAYVAMAGQALCKCMLLAKPEHKDKVRELFLGEIDKVILVATAAAKNTDEHFNRGGQS